MLLAVHVPRAYAQRLGYGIGGPAGRSGFVGSGTTLHPAGGGELLFGGRVGAGGEVGLFDRLVVVSVNGTVHLADARTSERFVPFVTGGYTRLGVGDGEGSFNAWNLAAGGDYWFGRRRGLRVEFRDHVRPDRRGTVHYWSARAGIVFR
jgi:hypothetical protein